MKPIIEKSNIVYGKIKIKDYIELKKLENKPTKKRKKKK
jgi:hypothetical protein